MLRRNRVRQLVSVSVLTGLALALVACTGNYPNSTFRHATEFNTQIDALWNRLLLWGTVVFIIVESVLIVTIVKFRRRPGSREPQHVHGNTALEISWTLAPAVILVFIAVPTVRTIFRTQAKAPASSLQVEVIGHQWWWEFRYPQYDVITANELYLPTGRTVNFSLTTRDVLHSFWIPQLGGKRDLISNQTNYLWFTPDSSLAGEVFNGSCNEFCGPSHANMRFRVFTVRPAEFESWARHQATPAVFSGAPATVGGAASLPAPAPAAPGVQRQAPPVPVPVMPVADTGFAFAANRLPAHAMPTTPVATALKFPDGLSSDATRGKDLYSRSACIGCHTIKGNAASVGIMGPNLTHFGSRTTLGAGLFPNDTRHLSLWIKNAPVMKPGIIMPALGKGEYDPVRKSTASGVLSDQDIADIVAYLHALK
jgi:cytochrome c oxidase subunit 2